MSKPARHWAKLGRKRSKQTRYSLTAHCKATRALTARRVVLLPLLASAMLAALNSPALVYATGLPHAAQTAQTLDATDTAHLHYIRSSGSELFEEGSASGTLPGSMRVRCEIGANVTASFTIYTNGGTIKGHGSAKPHGSGTYESFSGLLMATGGTGRYTHAHGHAGFYGVFNRKTYSLTVQTAGNLSY
jgi:hypothetical protein